MSRTQMFSRLAPRIDQQVEAGQRCRAGAGGDDLDVLDLLAGQLQAIQNSGGDDDGGAMLVVVENRNFHLFAQTALDLEAFRRLDVSRG